MTDAELFAFQDTFQRVVRVFPLRGDDDEIRDIGASYFKALRKWPLPAVQAGADAWIQQGKRFPKPAEWLESIPRRPVAVALPVLSRQEAEDYRRAEGLKYEDAPCVCPACAAAGVSEKPLRFVPESHADGTDRRVKDGERIVVGGHWAHGAELARYYHARAQFWNDYYAAISMKGMV